MKPHRKSQGKFCVENRSVWSLDATHFSAPCIVFRKDLNSNGLLLFTTVTFLPLSWQVYKKEELDKRFLHEQ